MNMMTDAHIHTFHRRKKQQQKFERDDSIECSRLPTARLWNKFQCQRFLDALKELNELNQIE